MLFGSYCVSVAGMVYFVTRIKLMDDFEKDIRDIREFDFHNEKLREESGKYGDKRAIVLATYKPPVVPESSQPISAEGPSSDETSRVFF